MHPDQSTPDDHRYVASDSQAPTPHAPEQEQADDAIDPDGETEDRVTFLYDGATVHDWLPPRHTFLHEVRAESLQAVLLKSSFVQEFATGGRSSRGRGFQVPKIGVHHLFDRNPAHVIPGFGSRHRGALAGQQWGLEDRVALA